MIAVLEKPKKTGTNQDSTVDSVCLDPVAEFQAVDRELGKFGLRKGIYISHAELIQEARDAYSLLLPYPKPL